MICMIIGWSLFDGVFLIIVGLCHRILDNLPLVVPLRRPDSESSIVYQHGFHVGLRGQYAGVSAEPIMIHLIAVKSFDMLLS